MKNVIVTGGAGYIGSHTCKELYESGYNPVVIDNLSTGNKEHLLWGDFEFGDIGDKEFLVKVFTKYKPLGIIHFAASSLVGESITNPNKYYLNNCFNSLNLLEAMKECHLDKIIFSSTCAIFGIPKKDLIDESCEKNPINSYGRSKLVIEGMLQDYDIAHGIKSVSLRYFNACGASKCGKIGEKHDPETHLIPLVIDTSLGKRKEIKIFGTDYPTRDGTCVRDYIHVEDLANAHVKSLEYIFKHNKSNQFNLGVGEGFTVKEIIDCVSKTQDTKVNAIEVDRRDGDPAILIADNKKAKNLLGWNPENSDITNIITSAVNWHKKDL